MPPVLRMASIEDAAGILEVYAPYILNTSITFEYEVPPIEEFKKRIEGILKKYPYLVCEENGTILGYAYAGPYRTRAAFGWDAELSVYIRPEAQRRGIATVLCRCIIEILREMGCYHLYSHITIPNSGSLALHKALGFVEEGRLSRTGFKLGSWHDMAVLSLQLAPLPQTPDPVRPCSAEAQSAIADILEQNKKFLRNF